jgi:1-pyrroline-5-carboxylate dehydrogenase
VTEYKENEIDTVIDIINNFDHHLTAGVVSNEIGFLNHVTANTVNGVTYTYNIDTFKGNAR